MHNNDQSNHPTSTTTSTLAATAPGQWRVIKRNGDVVLFDEDKISIAISKAFLAVEGEVASGSSRIHDRVKQLTEQVCATFKRRMPSGGTLHIEDIQDQVELALMRSGEHKIARSYVLYREQRAQQRAASQAISAEHSGLYVTLADGSRAPLDTERMALIINEACADLAHVNAQAILEEALKNLYDGIPLEQVNTSLVITARTMVERDPNYSKVTARLLLDKLRGEALAFLDIATTASQRDMATLYAHALPKTIKKAVELELLDAALLEYDLQRLAQALDAARDLQFNYLGLQTLYDRYFIHSEDVRFELPQVFFMRVAMGLAVNEPQKNERAIEFYRLLSSFDYMSSTPTLFNAGTLRPQLSSCYLTTIPDDLHGIYGALRDNAMLSKWAGGLGNDWTPVRALGSYIKGTNGKSQGTVPFMKVFSDSAVAVNQCFAPDTTVYTADGVKAIRDIKRGDLVLGQRGQYREVIEQMAYNQLDAMVEIRAKHALHPLRVTAGHPLWVIKGIPLQQGHQRSYDWLQKGKVAAQWVEAGQVERSDFVAQVIPQEIVPAAHIDMHDMRLYGILLGDGHCSKNGLEWGVSGNPDKDEHLDWVKNYLTERGMHYWEKNRRKNYLQIGWSANVGLAREATSGCFVRGNKRALYFRVMICTTLMATNASLKILRICRPNKRSR